jgi:isochorismate hydrolase
MTSEPVRDPLTDHLLTPQNAALVVIDYQPSQVNAVASMDKDLLVDNIVSVARTAQTFALPTVLSTVNVANGQQPTIPELRAVLSDSTEIDRTTLNAWEDTEFRHAVEATGRKKLIMTALWTEICLAFPSLDVLREGFEVYPVVTRWEAPRRKRTVPGSSESSEPVRRQSVGCRWHASFSGIGRARRPLPTSWTSCSPLGCSRAPECAWAPADIWR